MIVQWVKREIACKNENVIMNKNLYMKMVNAATNTNNSPCGLGDQNAANVCPRVCRKRQRIMGYKSSYTTTGLLYAWSSRLQRARRMGLDSWALGCPGSGKLFQRPMSFF